MTGLPRHYKWVRIGFHVMATFSRYRSRCDEFGSVSVIRNALRLNRVKVCGEVVCVNFLGRT